MEQMQYNLLFRWFVGLGIDDPVWVPTVFSKNRDRLLTTDIARQFLAAILADKAVAPLLSDEHFSVDGTLIQAWASMKSFQPKGATGDTEPADGDAGFGQDGGGSASEPAAAGSESPASHGSAPATERPAAGRNAEVDFHGQKRSNDTPASRTDPEVRLYRKGPGKEAKLCFMGHALMENRNGLMVDACLTQADGHAEREAALALIEPRANRPARITLGTDKNYDVEDFVNELRSMNVTPHVAAKVSGSAIDGRTTRHAGYALSQRIRKRIEEVFGWGKTVGPLAQTMLRGRPRRRAVHFHGGRLQSRPAAETARRMTRQSNPGEQERRRRKTVLPAPLFQQPARLPRQERNPRCWQGAGSQPDRRAAVIPICSCGNRDRYGEYHRTLPVAGEAIRRAK
jgi:hypothetical protein